MTTTKQSRVFVLEPISLNIAKAKRYGPIEFLFDANALRASFWDDTFKQQLKARLTAVAYRPLQDYFLVAGQIAPLAVSIATIVAAYGQASLLLYHAVERDYRRKIVGDTTHGKESTANTINTDAGRGTQPILGSEGCTPRCVSISDFIAGQGHK